MKTYYLQGVIKNPPQEVADAVASFWKGYVKIEIKTPPLPYVYLPTKQDLYDWVYALYVENWQINHDRLLNVIIIIPQSCLGSFKTMWEGTGFEGYQIATLKEQGIGTMKFVATHELGHLLGLSDELRFNRCIMNWIPTFLVPLRWRKICPKCRIKLGG